MGFFNKKKNNKNNEEELQQQIFEDINSDIERNQEMISMDDNNDNLDIEIAGSDIPIYGKPKISKKIFKKKKAVEEDQQLPDDLKQFGFVEMTGNTPTNDFEIIQDKKNFLGVFLNILKIVFACIVITLGIFCIYFSLSFKIIKENVRGADYIFNIKNSTYSILSKNHTPNLDELKIGDNLVIIESENRSKYNPFITKYTKIEYTSRNGVQIYGTDPSGATRKFASSEIIYVIPK